MFKGLVDNMPPLANADMKLYGNPAVTSNIVREHFMGIASHLLIVRLCV